MCFMKNRCCCLLTASVFQKNDVGEKNKKNDVGEKKTTSVLIKIDVIFC